MNEHLTRPEKAIENMVANGGIIEPAVIEAGYSEAYARSGKFQKTKQFQELLEEALPDDFLLSALKNDIVNKPMNRKPELELAFKVKGKLVDKNETKVEGSLTINQEVVEKINKALDNII